MATVAVFLALGGVATAAFTLPKKSVGPKQLKANAVTEPKIAAKAVTEGKLADGAVTASKLASGAAFRNITVKEVVVPNVTTNNSNVRDIQCDPGQVAIAGGTGGTIVGTRGFSGLDIDNQEIVDTPIDASGNASANGQAPTGWHLSAKVIFGPRDQHFYVVCAAK
jgi:hypothetical protein